MLSLVLIWGTAFVSIKVLLGVLDPFQLTWYRYVPLLALYGAWLLGSAKQRRHMAALGRADWLRVLLLGFLGVVGYHFTLNWGLAPRVGEEQVTGATGAILVATVPLWTLLISVAARREPFDAPRALGLLVAFGGVGVLTFLGRADAEGFTFAGRVLVMLLAPISWGTYTVLAKPLVEEHGGLFMTGITMCAGTLMLLPWGLAYGTEPLVGFTGEEWFWLAYIGIAATAAGYAMWNQALKSLQPTEVTAYIYLVPLVATTAGALLLDEPVTRWFLLGAALILAGVMQVNRARHRATAAAATAAAAAAAAAEASTQAPKS